jgi:hypothetical protein
LDLLRGLVVVGLVFFHAAVIFGFRDLRSRRRRRTLGQGCSSRSARVGGENLVRRSDLLVRGAERSGMIAGS